MTRGRAFALALAAAGIFVALDQATKQLVVHNIGRTDAINVFFGIDLVNVRNTGVAFGALAGGGVLIKALTAVALSALLAFFWLRSATPWLWLPVGVIVGGALGNLADRARDGAVIDFIDPILWPAFNLADMGIVVGILGLFYVVEGRRADRAPRAAGRRRG
ncbi:MAG: signal peptidase [Thermoleophilaceae bacterium]|nr:signal peptidase [Thermoleophilaceae bacterium]